jgi:hypothetical protein
MIGPLPPPRGESRAAREAGAASDTDLWSKLAPPPTDPPLAEDAEPGPPDAAPPDAAATGAVVLEIGEVIGELGNNLASEGGGWTRRCCWS